MSNRKKSDQLSNLKPRRYRIYGIFNFKTNKLIYVNLDQELTELEFDMSNYDLEIFDVVSFYVLLA